MSINRYKKPDRNKQLNCRASEDELKEIDELVTIGNKVSYDYVSRMDVIMKAIRYAKGEMFSDKSK